MPGCGWQVQNKMHVWLYQNKTKDLDEEIDFEKKVGLPEKVKEIIREGVNWKSARSLGDCLQVGDCPQG